MCGIVGLWNFRSEEGPEAVARRMARAIRHRGPEDEAVVASDRWAMGHARLAIIDVSGGNQPIWNEERTVAIIGNNEIYNAPELREELEKAGHRFRTHSDTEVALHAWEQWGEDAFARLNGMFALAILDLRAGERGALCVLARDPLGIKPLHLTRIGEQGYAFASEIKALLEVPGFRAQPNWDAVHLFMNFRYVPDERTLFEGVERLEPGSFAVLSVEGIRRKTYFTLREAANRSRQQAPAYEDAVARLRGILERSVSRHLISDVEVATYLSGGVDSSLVTALAAKASPGLRSFCVAFGEPTDENADAARVASLVGTRHEDLHVGSDPLQGLAEIIWHVEEPKINCVQGYLLAGAVSKRVKVALSGLGGDEFFRGLY